jgi:hypothetical protein
MSEWILFEFWLSSAAEAKFGDLAIDCLGYLPKTAAMKRYAFIVGFNIALDEDPDLILQHLSLMPQIPSVIPDDAMPHDELMDRIVELTGWTELAPSSLEEQDLASDLRIHARRLERLAHKLKINSSCRSIADNAPLLSR